MVCKITTKPIEDNIRKIGKSEYKLDISCYEIIVHFLMCDNEYCGYIRGCPILRGENCQCIEERNVTMPAIYFQIVQQSHTCVHTRTHIHTHPPQGKRKPSNVKNCKF